MPMDYRYLKMTNRFVGLRYGAKINWAFLLVFAFNFQISYCSQPNDCWDRFEIIPQKQENFTVYKIRPHIFLIRDISCFEDINCYLIIGKDRCLLFDTGLGLGNIKEVVIGLTKLPIVVLNSHTHYDHIGGNYLFDSIIGIESRYSNANRKGMSHETLLSFYKRAYIYSNSLLSCIPNNYIINPFSVSQFFHDNDTIDLGGLTLEIITTPGHTPDGVCLLDKKDSLLFSGDIINKGTLFLHLTESDFQVFSSSIAKINSQRQFFKYIMPGHGCTELEESCILELEDNIQKIKDGKVSFIVTNGVNFYNFSFFKYLVK